MLQSVQGNGATGNNNHTWRGRGRGSGSGRGIGVSNFDLYPDNEEFSSVPQDFGYGAILSCQITQGSINHVILEIHCLEPQFQLRGLLSKILFMFSTYPSSLLIPPCVCILSPIVVI